MEEIWKDIVGFEGYYQISNLGRVKSLAKKKGHKTDTIRKVALSEFGYYVIGLSKPKIRKSFKLHRLIAQHFIPNPENKPHINHINSIRTDNSISNLEWCTHLENIRHAAKNNRMGKRRRDVYVFNSNGELLQKYDSTVSCAKGIGVNRTSVAGVLRRHKRIKEFFVNREPIFPNSDRDYKKKVALIDDNGDIIQEFVSCSEAAKKLNLNNSSGVSHACRGEYQSYKGMKFKYI